jgi:hypothetical protein
LPQLAHFKSSTIEKAVIVAMTVTETIGHALGDGKKHGQSTPPLLTQTKRS